jgi:hypothetical protein
MDDVWRMSRRADFARHLADIRGGSYEGMVERGAKDSVFANAVELLAPVATATLQAFSRVMLAEEGSVEDSGLYRPEDGTLAREWRLSWPGQRLAERRTVPGGGVGPIVIRAHFLAGWTHGHLGGSAVGSWPLQVLDSADASRQGPIMWAIAEAELHERILEARDPWTRVPLRLRGSDQDPDGE